MLFNSLVFLLFLPVVFCCYWFIFNKNLKWQNMLLLGSSYVFYGWWDWRFLFLLVFSTVLDFYTGNQIAKFTQPTKKKLWLWISISINLAFLGFFKYYNFFVSSFAEAFASIGYKMDVWTLDIILPVGISFYTFHGLSYVIDIYYDRCKPASNWIDYSVFVSYFPLLVAGPIERATHLLPQIQKKREFNYNQAVDGVQLMILGFFKKVLIADSIAPVVNQIFGDYHHYSSLSLIAGAVFFSFQIYCDFSGYSDIARGVSKLFGMELLLNFNFPYLSRTIPEFWRRWHISLSSWFRDYIYIPLGGSKVSKVKAIRNIFIIFLVSGFWHGANWTFIVWGGLHAALFIPSFIVGSNRKYINNQFADNASYPGLREILQILGTFILATIAWIFFRAATVTEAWHYITDIVTKHSFKLNHIQTNTHLVMNLKGILGILILTIVELYIYSGVKKLPTWVYYILFALILVVGSFRNSIGFIYFQF